MLSVQFGISSAPEKFQRRQHEGLEGLTEAECVMDDTVVYGCGQIIESAILKELNLTKDKLRLCQTDVKYMGNIPPMASVLIWTNDSHYRYEKI